MSREGLGDFVHFVERDVHYPAYITQRRFGSHGAISDNLSYLIAAVFLDDVVEHLLTAFVVKVDIDIRHRDPLRVEEALEKQVVLDGVHVGDADAVGHG